jgi:hypothetical protein
MLKEEMKASTEEKTGLLRKIAILQSQQSDLTKENHKWMER